ncbi:MAG: hypothetical protein NTX05_08035 [Fusobacteria bacterium]|nr:hypothetical protein [Fusobacteriota bacterium]
MSLKTSEIKRWVKYFKVKQRSNKYENKSSNRVLLTMTDGLGDLVSRWTLMEKIIKVEQKQGNEVYILIKERVGEIYSFFDTNNTVVLFDRIENEKNSNKLVEELNELNSLGFNKIYYLEFGGNNRFLRLIQAKEKIAFFNYSHKQMNIGITRLVNVFPKKNIYFDVQNYYYELFKECISIEELSAPLFKSANIELNDKLKISIGVGANYIGRMASPEKLLKIIEKIYVTYPNIEITLIGKGQFEQDYAKRIMNNIDKNINIEDRVSLLDTKSIIGTLLTTDIYIGYDSGIYNLAFRLGVFCICLAGGMHDRYEHDTISKRVIVIKGKDKVSHKKNPYHPFHALLEEVDESLIVEAINMLLRE